MLCQTRTLTGGAADSMASAAAINDPATAIRIITRATLCQPGAGVKHAVGKAELSGARDARHRKEGELSCTAGVPTGEFTVLLDNALNHPQFYVPDLGTDGFLDLTDYLINGDPNNGATAVRGADTSATSKDSRRAASFAWAARPLLVRGYCFLFAAATHVSTSACDWPPRAL